MCRYYNFTDPKQGFDDVVEYFNNNVDEFYGVKNKFISDCQKIVDFTKRNDASHYEKIFELTVKIWPFTAIMNVLGDEDRDYVENIKRELVLECQKVRSKSEKIMYLALESMINMIKEILPDVYTVYASFLMLNEIKLGNYPDIEILIERTKSFFHKGELIKNESISEFAARNNFEILDEAVSDYQNVKNEIKGSVAFRGIIRGIARVVLEKSDLNSLKEGEILVTSMTAPDYISGMKKASAFVTDEGGITCHASIVAREMKKPCVIGTKIATKFLKDGDLVEVNANNGTIKIIKKA